ncbi:MAG: hypothetical protein JO332_01835 [Planctomycetaceae bacterium]|nr:hypothetical protein [Planctomycetaceae bacterium]
MGQAIVYCYRCSRQLREAQFSQGKAFRLDSRGCCADCAPEALRTLPPESVKVLLAQLAAAQQQKPGSPGGRPPTARRPVTEVPPPAVPRVASSAPIWIVAGVAVAAIAIVAGIALSAGPGTAAPRPSGGSPAPTEAKSSAALALQKARDFAAKSPNDLFAQLKFFEDRALLDDKTDVGAEARRSAQEIRAKGKETVDRARAALDTELLGPLGREEFSTAFARLDSARTVLEWPEWKAAVEKRAGEERARLAKLFEQVRDQARDAKEKANAAELQVHVARVKKWGVQKLVDDLAAALAEVSPKPVRVAIQDFEGELAGWKYVGGEDFPGARGSFAPDSTVVHGGRRACKLDADFNKGGLYVGFWWDATGLKARDVREIRLWVKTDTVSILGVRVADATGQVHQRSAVPLQPTSDWQELVLRIADLTGPEHWAGANDGKWHGPFTGFGLNIGKEGFRQPGLKAGAIWVDDIDALAAPALRDP